ncbi:hypothetical protein IGI52_000220 [Enterococcus sp. DIV0187]
MTKKIELFNYLFKEILKRRTFNKKRTPKGFKI